MADGGQAAKPALGSVVYYFDDADMWPVPAIITGIIVADWRSGKINLVAFGPHGLQFHLRVPHASASTLPYWDWPWGLATAGLAGWPGPALPGAAGPEGVPES